MRSFEHRLFSLVLTQLPLGARVLVSTIGGLFRGGGHRDPPEVDSPSLEFLKCTQRIVPKNWNMSDVDNNNPWNRVGVRC